MNLYQDPNNVSDLISQLDSLNTDEDIRQFINKIFPTWLVSFTNYYSNDYPHLENNWKTLLTLTKAKRNLIVLVDYLPSEEKQQGYKLLSHICEKMTQKGYIVRRKEEFIFCDNCSKAIPVEPLYEHMKKHNIRHIPKVWSNKCSNCS